MTLKVIQGQMSLLWLQVLCTETVQDKDFFSSFQNLSSIFVINDSCRWAYVQLYDDG